MRIEPLKDVLDIHRDVAFRGVDEADEMVLIVEGHTKVPFLSKNYEYAKAIAELIGGKVAVFDTTNAIPVSNRLSGDFEVRNPQELRLVALCDTKEELCELFD